MHVLPYTKHIINPRYIHNTLVQVIYHFIGFGLLVSLSLAYIQVFDKLQRVLMPLACVYFIYLYMDNSKCCIVVSC